MFEQQPVEPSNSDGGNMFKWTRALALAATSVLAVGIVGTPASAEGDELTPEEWFAAFDGDPAAVSQVEQALDAVAAEQTSDEAAAIAADGYAWVRFDLDTLEPVVAIAYPDEVVAELPERSTEELSTMEIEAQLSEVTLDQSGSDDSNATPLVASCADNADARIRDYVGGKIGCRAWEGSITQTVNIPRGYYAYAGDRRTGFRITGQGTLALEAGVNATWPQGSDIPFNRVSR